MPTTWKTVRVFISSTFRDMQAERDHLVRFVFPRLREDLLKRRIHLVEVDLRWGVTGEQDALAVCREIIDECRPRFLCILGGRYGWTPPGQDHSITAAEIRYGVLDRLGEHGYASFHFRDPAATDSIPEGSARAGGYREFPLPDEIEHYGVGQAEARARQRADKLAALKRAILDAGLKTSVYSPTWDEHQQRLAGLTEFGEQVYQDLWESMRLDPELQDRFAEEAPSAPDEFTEENEAMDAFVAQRTEHYVVGIREEAFHRLAAFVAAEGEPNVLVLTGNPGSGKSALLGKFYQDITAQHADWLVISHFIGASAGSTDLRRILRRFCHELGQATGNTEPISEDVRKLIPQLRNLLDQTAARRVVLVIDALNQMDAADGAHSLVWLPRQLPENIRVVVASLEHPVLDALRRRGKQVGELQLQPLTAVAALAIAEGFSARYHKRLSEEQLNRLLEKPDSATPLYLLVAMEELRTLGTYEEITDRIAQLPGNVRDLFRWILRDRLSSDPGFRDAQGKLIGADLVRRFLSYLGVSRHGLSHTELVDLIAPNDPQGNVAALERLLRAYLMRRGELLDFYHSQLREAVTCEYLDAQHERLAAHREVASYFRCKVDPDRDLSWRGDCPRGLSELPYHQTRAELWADLEYTTLCNIEFIEAKRVVGMVHGLLADYSDALSAWPDAADRAAIQAFSRMVLREASHLAKHPDLTFPQAYYHLGTSPVPGVRRALQHTQDTGKWKSKAWLKTLLRPTDGADSVLAEHLDKVTKVVVSPDGALCASASADGCIKCFRPPTGELLWQDQPPVIAYDPHHMIQGEGHAQHPRSAIPVALFIGSEIGPVFLLASGSQWTIDDGSSLYHMLVYDAATGQRLYRIVIGESGCTQCPTPSPDGERVLTRFEREGFKVWDAGTGHELKDEAGQLNMLGEGLLATDAHFALDWQENLMRLVDVREGHIVTTWQAAGRPIAAAFSGDKTCFVLQTSEQALSIRELPSGTEVRQLHAKCGPLRSWCFDANSRRLVALAGEHLMTWEVTHDRLVSNIRITSADSFQLLGGGSLALVRTASPKGKYVLCDLAAGKVFGVFPPTTERRLHDCISSGSKRWSALLSVRHRVELRDLHTLLDSRAEEGESERASHVAISPRGNWLLTVTPQNRILLRDLGADDLNCRTLGKCGHVGVVTFTDDDEKVAWVTEDDSLNIVETRTSNVVGRFSPQISPVVGCKFVSAGKEVLVWNRDQVRCWDLSGSRSSFTMAVETGWRDEPAYAPSLLLTISEGADIGVYHTRLRRRIRSYSLKIPIAEWHFDARSRLLITCHHQSRRNPYASSRVWQWSRLPLVLQWACSGLAWMLRQVLQVFSEMSTLNLPDLLAEESRKGPLCDRCLIAPGGRMLVYRDESSLNAEPVAGLWGRQIDRLASLAGIIGIPWDRCRRRRLDFFYEQDSYFKAEDFTVSGDGEAVVLVKESGQVTRTSSDGEERVTVFAEAPLVRCFTDLRGSWVAAMDIEDRLYLFALKRGADQ